MSDIEEQVAASGDDGYTYGASTFNNDAAYAYMGSLSSVVMHSFFRFTNVSIPAGATITAAKIQLRAQESDSLTTVNLQVSFENADSPSAPTSVSDLNGRTKTTGVNWNGVGAWTSGTWYDSPSLTSSLQEVIDRGGWAENNAINAFILNNSSSASAYRRASTYNASASYAAKLIVSFDAPETIEADLTDATGANDSADSFSLTDSVSDAAGAADATDAYNTTSILEETTGLSDSVSGIVELESSLSDTAGIADLTDAGFESYGEMADAAGTGDSADAFNWTAWLSANRDLAVVRYYCTLTGASDSLDDLEIPISSFQARKRSGESTYLSVVVPGIALAEDIVDRANGELVVEMAYLLDGVESLREEILRVDLEQINPSIGPRNRSITLIGHKTVTYDARAASIRGSNYKYENDGLLGFRFPQADPYLNPGDALTVVDTGDSLTVDYITYAISARGAKFMEVREG